MTLETDGKSAVASVGVWGSLLAFGGALLSLAQDPTIAYLIPLAWNPYIIAAGSIIALVGRLKASQKITSVIPK